MRIQGSYAGPVSIGATERSSRVGSSEDGCFSRCWDIDGIVRSAFGSCVRVCVEQLLRAHTGDRNDQVYLSDEVRDLGCRAWFWW